MHITIPSANNRLAISHILYSHQHRRFNYKSTQQNQTNFYPTKNQNQTLNWTRTSKGPTRRQVSISIIENRLQPSSFDDSLKFRRAWVSYFVHPSHIHLRPFIRALRIGNDPSIFRVVRTVFIFVFEYSNRQNVPRDWHNRIECEFDRPSTFFYREKILYAKNVWIYCACVRQDRIDWYFMVK